MILSMIWKEWREQRAIGLAILAFGAGAIALTAQMTDPVAGGSSNRALGVDGASARELIAVALAYLAGSVCGAMLIADEKEAGTVEFLQGLPSTRWNLWVGKTIFGIIFTVLQCALLTVIAVTLNCLDVDASVWKYGTFVVLIGVLSFAWGMFGGTLARSTLGAVFCGAGGSMLCVTVLSVVFAILFRRRTFPGEPNLVLFVFYALWLLAGLSSTAAVFTRIDRARRSFQVHLVSEAWRGKAGWRSGTLATLWLALRQSSRVAFALWALGLFFGALMVSPAVQPVFVWPVATLCIGVIAGTTALGEEQTRGIARFWAERRLPLGRLWLIKVSFHFTIATIAALLMFLPLLAATPMSPFRTALFTREALRPELFRFLFLGLVFGFVVGHLCGMLFRKTIVAGLASIVAAATFAGLILPAIVGGGASAWQVWAPAFALLLTARALVYPWANERIAARGPILRAAGGASLAMIVLGLGVLFRIYEIPEASDELAESGFEQSIPTYEQNEGGRQARSAAAQFRRAAQDAQPLLVSASAGGPGRSRGPGGETTDPVERVARRGWDEGAGELKPWLDRVFAADWLTSLDELHEKPLGVFEDPRDTDVFTPSDSLRDLRDMQFALRARMNQRVAEGHPEECPRLLRNGLLAARTANNKCGIAYANIALDSEQLLFEGLRDWLASTAGEPDALRALLLDLDQHERGMPGSIEELNGAEEIRLRNTMDRMGNWVSRLLESNRFATTNSGQVEAEAEFAAVAWNVPWERLRRERILRFHTHADLTVPEDWLSGLHVKHLWRPNRAARMAPREAQALTSRRFAVLKAALRLFEVESGAPAQSLDQLVPKYLASVPVDPYSGQPFHYRLSQGEIINAGALDDRDPSVAGVYVGAAVASSLSQPIGGWNGAWVISRLITPTPSDVSGPGRFMTVGVSIGGQPLPQVPPSRSRIALRGTGIIWSVGPNGTDDSSRRRSRSADDAGRNLDWLVLLPSVQNLPKKEQTLPK
jgi:ABC-2 family transporter protein